MSNLPLDILIDIFLQLPTKSLGQCNCVCKSWRYLISNPKFAKLHLNRVISSGENKLGLILVPRLCPSGLEPRFGFENVDINIDTNLVDPHVDVEPLQIDFEIVGSCNGLVCLLYFPNRFVLWNPTIKESKDIPHSPNSVDDYVMLFYGFGYDSSTDDYNLVRNVRSNSTKTTLFEIYSLKANSWRSIGQDSDSINIDILTKKGMFLNGSLHWVANRGMNQTSPYQRYDVIVVLDLKRNKFEFWEIIKPRSNSCYEVTLGVLGGCLSLHCNEDHQIPVWVMKDYGASESWTWLTSLVFNEFFYCDYVTPICCGRDDELILDIDGYNLTRYHIKDWSQMLLKIYDNDWFSCVVYVESLISPNMYQR